VLFLDEASNLGHTTLNVNEIVFAGPGRSAVSGNEPLPTDHCSVDLFESLKLVGVILAALVASRTIWSGVQARYRKGWGSRQVWRKKLNLLANGATAEYVEDLLGTPVFGNQRLRASSPTRRSKPRKLLHLGPQNQTKKLRRTVSQNRL
jgi:hypothetical protein